MQKATLDPAVLQELQELNTEPGENIVGDLARLFGEQAPAAITTLRRAHAAGDERLFVRTAHSLKSSAAALGATELAKRCRILEEESTEAPAEMVLQRIDSAESEVSRVLSALKEYLG